MLFHDLVVELDALLDIRNCDAVDGAINGLQVSRNNTPITACAVAVDACMDSFQRAVDAGAQLLLVHHGMYWGKQQAVVGTHFQRVRFLIDNGLALYAAHLPLDIHASFGNNIAICEALGLHNIVPFGSYKGVPIGYGGELQQPLTAHQISALFMERQMESQYSPTPPATTGHAAQGGIERGAGGLGGNSVASVTSGSGGNLADGVTSGSGGNSVGDTTDGSMSGTADEAAARSGLSGGTIPPLGILPFGSEKCTRVAVVSGGGGFALDEAIAHNYDILITGDTSYPAYYTAYEAGINVLFAGHYATETWGVKRIAAWLNGKGLTTTFVDLPTGL